MSTVDEILASGNYRDRAGRLWERCGVGNCLKRGQWWSFHDMALNGGRHFNDVGMRLLIERDQHRDVCPGIGDCTRHPVPTVIMGNPVDDEGPFYLAIKSHNPFGKWSHNHAEAMDFARALGGQS